MDDPSDAPKFAAPNSNAPTSNAPTSNAPASKAPNSKAANSNTSRIDAADQSREGLIPPRPRRQSPFRVSCPHCCEPLEIGEEQSEDECVCPVCGDTFQLDSNPTCSWTSEKLPTLGKFQLLSVAGKGAFGTVYRARDVKLDRIVAVKVPRNGQLTSKTDEDRFVREARNAARLHHTGIVPVYEVGRSETFPYIVSEFVEGMTLADALTGRRFRIHETASIVAQVADALDHAHQQGVVHRDIKPSNVMLESTARNVEAGSIEAETVRMTSGSSVSDSETGGAECRSPYRPRLTDFGLARRDEAEITVTLEGQVLGTPAYMSPEQARGESHRVDRRSDVYSLGVVLFEMLAGELPFRGNTRMLLHQVLNDDPPSLRRQNDRIPRDLETICHKCMQKDPDARYPTARQLCDDLRRFLRAEPIHARRVSVAERTWRWCRRHPALASVSSLFLFSLLTSMVLITWQWRRAESALATANQERDRAEKSFEILRLASDDMIDVFEQWLARMPEDEPVRNQLLQKSLTLYEPFLVASPANPSVRAEVALAHHRTARIRQMLGQHRLAREHYDQAIAGFRQLAEQLQDHPEYQRMWALSCNWLGECQRENSDSDDAELNYRQAIRLLRPLVDANPQDASAGADLARSYYNLGLLLSNTDRRDEAESFYRRAISLLQSLGDRHPNRADVRQHAARSHINLGILLKNTNRPREAEREYRQAVQFLSALARDVPTEPEYQYELATALLNLANLLYLNRQNESFQQDAALTEAQRCFDEAIESLRGLSLQYASVPKYRKELANSFNGLGSVYYVQNQWNDAQDAWQNAQAQFEVLCDQYPHVADHHSLLGLVLDNLARIDDKLDQPAEAIRHLELAIKHQQKAVQANPDNLMFQGFLYGHIRRQLRALVHSGNHQRAAQIAPRLTQLRPADFSSWHEAARILADCLALVVSDPQVNDPEKATLVASYAEQTAQHLTAAVERGLDDLTEWRRDQIAEPLRQRDDFQRLVRE